MRIQNTEMEFISFDAQDVIATSGFANTFLIANWEQASAYNTATAGLDLGTTASALGENNSNKTYLYSTDSKIISGDILLSLPNTLTGSGAYSGSNGKSSLEVAEADLKSKGKTYFVGSSIEVISSWLLANGFNQ